jgi:hypothetical protein
MTAVAWVMLVVGIIIGAGIAWGIISLVNYFNSKEEYSEGEDFICSRTPWPH